MTKGLMGKTPVMLLEFFPPPNPRALPSWVLKDCFFSCPAQKMVGPFDCWGGGIVVFVGWGIVCVWTEGTNCLVM